MTTLGDRPSFSVIVPVYDGEKTIERAIRSILNQTYSAHEIIIVNDGSRDKTAEVVREFHDRVIYVEQDNLGVAAARNNGAAVATGEWLAFLDADDWYYPGRLADHARLLGKERDLDFIVSGFDYLDNRGNRLRGSMESSHIGRILQRRADRDGHAVMEEPDIGDFILDQFSDTRTLSVPRETFTLLGGFPPQFSICEDVAFLIKLCAHSHRAGVVVRPSAVYVVHDEGLIRSDILRAQRETVKVLRWLEGELTAAPPSIRNGWIQLVKKAYLNMAYCLLRSEDKREALISLWKSFIFKPAFRDIKDAIAILAT